MNGFMKITKVQTPPKDIAHFNGANYPVDDEGINPEDVVEIFNTPLTGSYNWDYTVQDNRIKKLYELGKEKNWNVEEDINWDVDNPDEDETAFMFFNEQWKEHKDYQLLSIEQRKDFVQDLNNWTLAQLLHGEQGALLVASQLTSCAPTFNAKLYAASQTFDEARHVEAFNKYIQTRVGRMFPIGTQLKALLDKILTDPRWDLKFIGMQIIIEGLALAIFNTIKQTTTDPVLRGILTLVIRDEARHVTFGVNYLEDYLKTLSKSEIEDRAQFAFEACVVMRNRLISGEVISRFLDYTPEEAQEIAANTAQGQNFRVLLFTKIVPNLKRIGLLTDKVAPQYEKLGVLSYAELEDNFNIDWADMSKPYETQEEIEKAISLN